MIDVHEEEIDDLKENMERKEYHLQNAEYKYQEYEKILKRLAPTDAEVRRKLAHMNVNVNTEHKVSNVVQQHAELQEENRQLRAQVEELKESVQEMQEALQHNENELTIFKEKVPNVPMLMLNPVRKCERNLAEHAKKMEENCNYLAAKIRKLKKDHSDVRSENLRLKESNDNSLLMVERLKQQLVKAREKNNAAAQRSRLDAAQAIPEIRST